MDVSVSKGHEDTQRERDRHTQLLAVRSTQGIRVPILGS